jgi:hypothetical protein
MGCAMSPGSLKFSTCLIALMFALGPTSSRPAAAADVVVKSFGAGDGPDNVGIVDASEDTEIDGPQALTTDASGDVYLLDQVNGRIVKFDPKQPSEEPRILEMPNQLQPTDLIVRKSDILVWDGNVHTLQAQADPGETSYRGLEEINTRAADDNTVVSGFAQMGSVDPGDATALLDPNTRAISITKVQPRPRQYVATRGGGSVAIDVIGEGESGAQIEVRRQGEEAGPPMARLALKVQGRLGAVEFLEIDNQGRMFVFAEDVPTSGAIAGAFVARYSTAGELEGVYELPLSNVPLSRRFVTVSADGDVYFLRTQRTGVEVLGMGFRPVSGRKAISIRVAGLGPAVPMPSAHGAITAVRPLTRQQVIETAFAFEGIQWQVNNGAYGRDPDTVCSGFAGRIRRPFYIHGKLGQQVRGVPYCWGCMGSLSQISYKIERGMLAGNICTHNEPRNDAAGVDCSGFVSATWGLATHFSTAAIPSIARQLSDPWELRPGDALDKPGSHVVLFLRFTPNRMAEVMEASPGACNGRVCRNVYPLSSLLARGFRPVRFRALENDTSTVASIEPPQEDKATAKVKRHSTESESRARPERGHHTGGRHRHLSAEERSRDR